MARKANPKPEDVEVHFNAVLAAAGHVVPSDRRAGLLDAYRDMRKQTAMLRNVPLGAELEPANTFSLVPYAQPEAETA